MKHGVPLSQGPTPSAVAGRRPLPLSAWLFASVLLTAIITIAAVATVVDHLINRLAHVEADRHLQVHADALRDALDRGMAHHVAAVQLLSVVPPLGAQRQTHEVRAVLEAYTRLSPDVAWIGLTTKDGKVLAANGGLLEGKDVSGRPWFKGAMRGLFVGDVHDAVLLARLLPAQAEPWRFVDIALPLRDEAGQIVAVLGAHLSWTWAERLQRDIATQLAQQPGAHAMLIAADRSVLIGPPELQGKKLAASEFGRSDYVWAQANSEDNKVFKSLGWQVVVRQPTAAALAPFSAVQGARLKTSALVLAGLLPLLWWVARRLSAPLRDIASSLERHHPLPSRAAILYREAQVLRNALEAHDRRNTEQTAALKAMADDLEQRVINRTEQLGHMNRRLSATVDELARIQGRTSSILRQSPDAFLCTDEAGRITDWNPAAERLFGWTQEEALGRELHDLLIPAEHVDGHNAGMAKFKVTGTGPVIGKSVELPARHKSGTVFTAEFSIGALQVQDGYLAFAFVRDIHERLAAQAAVQQSRERLQQVLENIPALVGYFDSDVHCRYANQAGRRLKGLARGAELGLHLREAIGADNYALHEPYLPQVLAGKKAQFDGTVNQQGVDVHFQVHMVPEKGSNGEVTGFYLMTFDVTAVKRAQKRLHDIADNLPVMISYMDAEQRVQFVNRTFEAWSGVTAAQAIGQRLADVIDGELYEQRRVALQKALQGETVEFEVVSRSLGVERVLQTVYVPDRGNGKSTAGVYALSMDVTALRRAEQRMGELARTDTLTGLANRRRFEETLPLALARVKRMHRGLALMFLDLDRFKSINDTFGHAAGDQVLLAFGQRLIACVRNTDLVARLAGDEFVVLLEGLNHADECHVLAAKVNAAARESIPFEGGVLEVSTSVGIAYVPADSHCAPEELLRHADAALYQTKERGRDGYTTVTVDEAEANFETSGFGSL